MAKWLRCCATNRKVTGSIPDGVIGIFIDINSFRFHYDPGVDPASIRVPGAFRRGKGGRCMRLTTYHNTVPLSRNLGTSTSWNPLGPSGPVTGLLYLYFYDIGKLFLGCKNARMATVSLLLFHFRICYYLFLYLLNCYVTLLCCVVLCCVVLCCFVYV